MICGHPPLQAIDLDKWVCLWTSIDCIYLYVCWHFLWHRHFPVLAHKKKSLHLCPFTAGLIECFMSCHVSSIVFKINQCWFEANVMNSMFWCVKVEAQCAAIHAFTCNVSWYWTYFPQITVHTWGWTDELTSRLYYSTFKAWSQLTANHVFCASLSNRPNNREVSTFLSAAVATLWNGEISGQKGDPILSENNG